MEKDNARASMNCHDNSAGVFLGTTKYKITFFLFDDAIRIFVENMNVCGFRILIKIIILWSMFNWHWRTSKITDLKALIILQKKIDNVISLRNYIFILNLAFKEIYGCTMLFFYCLSMHKLLFRKNRNLYDGMKILIWIPEARVTF